MIWRARHEPRLRQLDDILNAYPPAEREHARRALTDRQQQMVDELLKGPGGICDDGDSR